ncbi:MAG: M48 metallopeptidase family protein, partial [Bacilli bacterium]
FGACYYKKALITFACMLLQYDYMAIDYDIIHELAHFIHPNHSKRFYYLIQKYMPNYKEAEALLKNKL